VSAIDERTAWELVRGVVPGSAARGLPARSRAALNEDVWVDVEVDGSWRASREVSDAARDVFDIYLPVRVAREVVVGQLGQSLDGRIATDTGASHFVTGRKDIERLHRLRALVDAVVVGASTVAQDDPMLTVRLVDGPSPVRVVLDPSGRLEGSHKVFTEPTARPLVAVRAGGEGFAADASREELPIPWSDEEGFDLAALVKRLHALGLARILVEGGGVTVSGFLRAGLLDRLHITVAPMLIGSGRPSITLDSIASLDEALRPSCRRFILGEDVLFDLDLRAGRG